ncbi:MAG: hypothetical protein AAGJ46_18025 [Planctomycetota bacterium]
MNDELSNRTCPSCPQRLVAVWRSGSIEMGRCRSCGEPPIATVYNGPGTIFEVETDFDVVVVHDGKRDFFVRLSRLVPEHNAVQLLAMALVEGKRRVVRFGALTNTIDLPRFMDRVRELGLEVELDPEPRG